ncbi:hypothetical protein [Thalassiella azotivora]
MTLADHPTSPWTTRRTDAPGPVAAAPLALVPAPRVPADDATGVVGAGPTAPSAEPDVAAGVQSAVTSFLSAVEHDSVNGWAAAAVLVEQMRWQRMEGDRVRLARALAETARCVPSSHPPV